MGSLRARFGCALVAFALATLLSVGGALWLVLRDLHRDAGSAALAELVLPYVSQARQRLAPGPARGPGVVDGVGGRLLDLRRFVQEAQAEVREAGVTVVLAQADGGLVAIAPDGSVSTGAAAPDVPVPVARGEVSRGSVEVPGMGPMLYAATPILAGRRTFDVDGLVLLRPDGSAGLATEDLLRALLIAAVVLLAIGAPLAAWLARSMARPLERLADAAQDIARGGGAVVLPVDGPTEVAATSAAFNAMAMEVERSRERQRRLLADLRHDLRTPVTVIGGFAEALRDRTAGGAAADRAADAIAHEAARLEHMLADLDGLTALDPMGTPLDAGVLEVADLARDALERFASQAGARGQHIEACVPERGAKVLGDRVAVERILANLVDNALRHARSPGGRIDIEVRRVHPAEPPVGGPGGWRGRDAVILAVRDDGPGIPAASLPLVFDRFYRADPARSGPGTGLGLAIVADLAHAMGGRAFAENTPGGGARVGIVLPIPGAAPVTA
jgi:signal transduction histidine kinase